MLPVLFSLLVSWTVRALIFLWAWNLGLAPMLHLGTIDWAGAFFLVLLKWALVGPNFLQYVPNPINKEVRTDEPPERF